MENFRFWGMRLRSGIFFRIFCRYAVRSRLYSMTLPTEASSCDRVGNCQADTIRPPITPIRTLRNSCATWVIGLSTGF